MIDWGSNVQACLGLVCCLFNGLFFGSLAVGAAISDQLICVLDWRLSLSLLT
mgnify:CR=1 FL=1